MVIVLLFQVNHQVWMWSKDKFEHRRFMIEELYMKFLEDSSSLKHLPRSKDPFWDPVEDIYLGWFVLSKTSFKTFFNIRCSKLFH